MSQKKNQDPFLFCIVIVITRSVVTDASLQRGYPAVRDQPRYQNLLTGLPVAQTEVILLTCAIKFSSLWDHAPAGWKLEVLAKEWFLKGHRIRVQ